MLAPSRVDVGVKPVGIFTVPEAPMACAVHDEEDAPNDGELPKVGELPKADRAPRASAAVFGAVAWSEDAVDAPKDGLNPKNPPANGLVVCFVSSSVVGSSLVNSKGMLLLSGCDDRRIAY